MINLLRLAITAPLLGYAAYCDLKTWYVSDYVWVAGLVAAVVLDAWGLFTGSVGWVDLVGVGLLFGAVLLLDRLTHVGGADKLAVLTVAALNPGLLFTAYYMATLAMVTCVLMLITRRKQIPYLPVLSVCYLVTLFV
jgi:Flp pilus assembly protein protease CpaA